MSDNKPAKRVAPPLAKGDRNDNPAGIGFIALLREDLHTHNSDLLDQGSPSTGSATGEWAFAGRSCERP